MNFNSYFPNNSASENGNNITYLFEQQTHKIKHLEEKLESCKQNLEDLLVKLNLKKAGPSESTPLEKSKWKGHKESESIFNQPKLQKKPSPNTSANTSGSISTIP
ncbi:hypothetical protein O181_007942 [Austropuccinia psidii MF-1]|uniref:Uncharacterized protein n=1 Tax=Austropuccinia psidii MF-1 TaxID=1389203 RepID=A0A9Q3BNS7_9BASI|nr:hypothetical protein [Austropuccinia psidii MF-1]